MKGREGDIHCKKMNGVKKITGPGSFGDALTVVRREGTTR